MDKRSDLIIRVKLL